MKVCERCGKEIFTKDGDNRCAGCEDKPAKRKPRRKSERDLLMESLGLVKVKGALGGTYWE